jgi:diadenosine tetraphosphatase ApaH/serine/threonine PP2A family protein phosphatase
MTLHSADTVASAPRRIGIVSDVHGNLPAWRAVLEDVRGSEADAIWCLGDLVGYGAQPDECVAVARVTGELDLAEFSRSAAAAAAWTREHISSEALDYLRGLKPLDPERVVGLYHASPRDPVWEYVLSTWQAADCIRLMPARVGAVGHSHVALFFRQDDGANVVGAQAPGGTELDLSQGRWLLNPGGVGQPRDGDPRAAWLLLDTESWTATWRRVEYPIDEAAGAIEAAGLPAVLAERLYVGQ